MQVEAVVMALNDGDRALTAMSTKSTMPAVCHVLLVRAILPDRPEPRRTLGTTSWLARSGGLSRASVAPLGTNAPALALDGEHQVVLGHQLHQRVYLSHLHVPLLPSAGTGTGTPSVPLRVPSKGPSPLALRPVRRTRPRST